MSFIIGGSNKNNNNNHHALSLWQWSGDFVNGHDAFLSAGSAVRFIAICCFHLIQTCISAFKILHVCILSYMLAKQWTSLLVCLSLTKLTLLMRLRRGPSPASCSDSGVHLPACRHVFTPGAARRSKSRKKINKKEREKMIKAVANHVDLRTSNDDKELVSDPPPHPRTPPPPPWRVERLTKSCRCWQRRRRRRRRRWRVNDARRDWAEAESGVTLLLHPVSVSEGFTASYRHFDSRHPAFYAEWLERVREEEKKIKNLLRSISEKGHLKRKEKVSPNKAAACTESKVTF